MAYRRRRRTRSKRSGSTASGKVPVKGHTRDPRGPNKGKKRVRVKPYKRKLPRV